MDERYACAEIGYFDPWTGQPNSEGAVPMTGAGSKLHDPRWTSDMVLDAGEQNPSFLSGAVYLVFATPEEEVFHLVPGTLEPSLFLEEMEFADRLWEALEEAPEADRPARARIIRDAHRARAERLREAPPSVPPEGLPGDRAGHVRRYAEIHRIQIDTHHLHARMDPPTVRGIWEVARLRMTILMRFPGGAARLGERPRDGGGMVSRFYTTVGGY